MVLADSPAEAVQQKLNAIRYMTASFTETVSGTKKAISKTTGKMALYRPARFRWETRSPISQWVIADGKKLWVYDIDLEQVTVKAQQKGIGDTAGLFLSGYNETLSKDFTVTYQSLHNQDVYTLKSVKKQSDFQTMALFFEKNVLVRMMLLDMLNQETDIHFSNIKMNQKPIMKLFEFRTPKGVDVIEQ